MAATAAKLAKKKVPVKAKAKKLKGKQLPLPVQVEETITFSSLPVRRLVVEKFTAYQGTNIKAEDWVTLKPNSDKEPTLLVVGPTAECVTRAVDKLKHINGLLVVNRCRCGKPASFRDEELSEGFCSESCRKGAQWGKSVNAPVAAGMVCRLDRLAPGQRFKVEMNAPGWPGPTYTGHLVYATSGRARVELDKVAETKTFVNSRTGKAVELTGASVRQVDWAPEVEVEVLMGMKEFPLLSPKGTVEKSERRTATEKENDMAKKKAAKKAAGKSNGAGRKAANLEAQEVKLVKFPAEEDKVRGNQLAVLEVLKDNGKKMTAAELVKKLKTPTKNKNGQLAVWTFNRPILIDKGYITVSEAA